MGRGVNISMNHLSNKPIHELIALQYPRFANEPIGQFRTKGRPNIGTRGRNPSIDLVFLSHCYHTS